MSQRDLFDDSGHGAEPPRFDGGFLEDDDHNRLGRQLRAVRSVMADGEWRTLPQIQRELHLQGIEASTQSISARMRDFRKEKFGSHTVNRQRIEGGLYRYRLIVATGVVT